MRVVLPPLPHSATTVPGARPKPSIRLPAPLILLAFRPSLKRRPGGGHRAPMIAQAIESPQATIPLGGPCEVMLKLVYEEASMKVRVLYFASVRDIAGTTEETLELEAGTKTKDLLEALIRTHPELKGLEPSLAISVNQEYAARDAPLADGDEVALIPPVSGGQSSPAGTYTIVDRTVDLNEVSRLVRRDSSGAVAAFGGTSWPRSSIRLSLRGR